MPARADPGSDGAIPGLFDSHLHLTDPRFDGDRDEVLTRAREAGVTGLVTVATGPDDARRALVLAETEDDVWATAGLHPHSADRYSETLLRDVARLLRRPRVRAVGETGLDYHYDNAPRETQRHSFAAHLSLAEETGLPCVVHARDADEDTAALLREFEGRAGGVLHCFTAGRALLETGLAAGWYVSFSGIVTFAEEVASLVSAVPDDRLLVETDSPYLSPAPRRGRRNEPAHLPHTCRRVAELRGEEAGAVAELTARNARALYGLDRPGDPGP